MESEGIRVDKWLWAVRLYKTRSIATEACKKGKVKMDAKSVKPSRLLKEGDILELNRDNIFFTYKVKKLLGKRVGAKLVDDYLINITTPDQQEALEMHQLHQKLNRSKGLGRPTKKDRRDLEDLFAPD